MSVLPRAAALSAIALALLAAVPATDAFVQASNGIYRVYMGQTSDIGYPSGTALGQWSAMTDAGFGTAAQNMKSILFDAAGQETGFTSMEQELSVRSFTSNTVYAQNTGLYGAEAFALTQLSTYPNTVTATGPQTQVQYTITGADQLTVTQQVTVGNNGGGPPTSANSWIQVEVTVCNNGLSPVTLAIRSHWDLMVAGTDLNDKAWVSDYDPLTVGPFDADPEDVTNFAAKVAFETRDPANTFSVYGLIVDPPGSPFPEPVVTPSRVVYTRWVNANYAWGYSTAGGSIYGDTDPDSSVLYFWGGDNGTSVPPGECFIGRTYITLDLSLVTPPDPVTCTLGTTGNPVTGTSITFNAAGGDGTYTWSSPGGSPSSGSGAAYTTSYSTPGVKTITVTSNGQSVQCTVTVTAPPNVPPVVAIAGGSPDTCADSVWSFTGSVSDPGPDGNGGTSGAVTSAVWDFGDGSPTLFWNVMAPPPPPPTHQYASAGTYAVTLTATDNGGLTTTSTYLLTTVGDVSCCPVLAPIAPIVVYEGSPISFQAVATDAENDPRTFSINPLPGGASFTTTGAFSWPDTLGRRGTHPLAVTVQETGAPAGCGSTATVVLRILPPYISVPDEDQDGVADDQDNCWDVYNPLQDDADENGVGNICETYFAPEANPETLLTSPTTDSDEDGIADEADNCPADPNPLQVDTDANGFGDACDAIAGGAAGTATRIPLAAQAGVDCAECAQDEQIMAPRSASLTPAAAVGGLALIGLAVVGILLAVVLGRRRKK